MPLVITDTTTATDIVDQLTEASVRITAQATAGEDLSAVEFGERVARVFAAAFTNFMSELDEGNPELAARFQRQLQAEHQADCG